MKLGCLQRMAWKKNEGEHTKEKGQGPMLWSHVCRAKGGLFLPRVSENGIERKQKQKKKGGKQTPTEQWFEPGFTDHVILSVMLVYH